MHYFHIVLLSTDGVLVDPPRLSFAENLAIRRRVDDAMAPFNANHPMYMQAVCCEACEGRGMYKGELCTDCDGSGQVEVNPNGHWDWYRIGGRWDGVIIGQADGADHACSWPCLQSGRHNTLAANAVMLQDCMVRVARSILLPTGEWRILCPWLRPDDPQAKAALSALKTQYGRCLAVGIDYHY